MAGNIGTVLCQETIKRGGPAHPNDTTEEGFNQDGRLDLTAVLKSQGG